LECSMVMDQTLIANSKSASFISWPAISFKANWVTGPLTGTKLKIYEKYRPNRHLSWAFLINLLRYRRPSPLPD
jgi:hypothetical protein